MQIHGKVAPSSNVLHNCGELSYDINGKYTLRDCTINLGSVSIKDKTIIGIIFKKDSEIKKKM